MHMISPDLYTDEKKSLFYYDDNMWNNIVYIAGIWNYNTYTDKYSMQHPEILHHFFIPLLQRVVM